MYDGSTRNVAEKESLQFSDSLNFERVISSYSNESERALLIKRLTSSEKYYQRGRPSLLQHTTQREPPILFVSKVVPANAQDIVETSSDLKNSAPHPDNLLYEGDRDPFVCVTESSSGENEPHTPGETTNLHQEKKCLNLFRYSGPTVMRWLLSCFAGILTGLLAVLVLFCIEKMVVFRLAFLEPLAAQGVASSAWASFILIAGYNATLALVSAILTLKIAPEAAGSGIPEVKVYLNGIRTPKFSDPTLFFVKIVGTILSVSSGLAVGPEGPMVHLGAILGALITRTRWLDLIISKLDSRYSILKNNLSQLRYHLSFFCFDESKRYFISIGAASGFAASFGAPIGGVLFSMEEASSFFTHNMLSNTLVGSTLATFCIACYNGDLSKYSALERSLKSILQKDVASLLIKIPCYALIGVSGSVCKSDL
eukprot:CAMPEP_0172428612 /NCGR_PEP_ID=MMETSP1064-20121228/47074_1 /TAXON_ID=202472 /ORGANISM="Aulacoseira subarctica , Strain CCAP 1002/5" /LENGTH=425 /DNA_ID=CAMNT_0013173477 /DNA_START=202 /DNA_END=1475 /DNA_ORIENTATION=-